MNFSTFCFAYTHELKLLARECSSKSTQLLDSSNLLNFVQTRYSRPILPPLYGLLLKAGQGIWMIHKDELQKKIKKMSVNKKLLKQGLMWHRMMKDSFKKKMQEECLRSISQHLSWSSLTIDGSTHGRRKAIQQYRLTLKGGQLLPLVNLHKEQIFQKSHKWGQSEERNIL